VALLTLTTAVSWHVSFVMPDILAAVLILALVVLGFEDRLTPLGRVAAGAAFWFAIVSHTSHLALGLVLVPVFVVGRVFVLGDGVRLAFAKSRLPIGVLVLAGVSLTAINGVYDGRLSVMGKHPPHVLARLIEDGTATRYLREHCPQLDSPLCEHLDQLPQWHWIFLFEDEGVLAHLSEAQRDQVIRDEWSLVLATVRSTPLAQLRASFGGFVRSLRITGVRDFIAYPYTEAEIGRVARNGARMYEATRQFRGTLPLRSAEAVQRLARSISLVLLLCFGWLLRRRREARWLLLMIGVGFVTNAAITGVLSSAQPRYTTRVDWLLPLAAMLLIGMWWEERTRESSPSGARSSALPTPAGHRVGHRLERRALGAELEMDQE
jgi:hypothetical protein